MFSLHSVDRVAVSYDSESGVSTFYANGIQTQSSAYSTTFRFHASFPDHSINSACYDVFVAIPTNRDDPSSSTEWVLVGKSLNEGAAIVLARRFGVIWKAQNEANGMHYPSQGNKRIGEEDDDLDDDIVGNTVFDPINLVRHQPQHPASSIGDSLLVGTFGHPATAAVSTMPLWPNLLPEQIAQLGIAKRKLLTDGLALLRVPAHVASVVLNRNSCNGRRKNSRGRYLLAALWRRVECQRALKQVWDRQDNPIFKNEEMNYRNKCLHCGVLIKNPWRCTPTIWASVDDQSYSLRLHCCVPTSCPFPGELNAMGDKKHILLLLQPKKPVRLPNQGSGKSLVVCPSCNDLNDSLHAELSSTDPEKMEAYNRVKAEKMNRGVISKPPPPHHHQQQEQGVQGGDALFNATSTENQQLLRSQQHGNSLLTGDARTLNDQHAAAQRKDNYMHRPGDGRDAPKSALQDLLEFLKREQTRRRQKIKHTKADGDVYSGTQPPPRAATDPRAAHHGHRDLRLGGQDDTLHENSTRGDGNDVVSQAEQQQRHQSSHSRKPQLPSQQSLNAQITAIMNELSKALRHQVCHLMGDNRNNRTDFYQTLEFTGSFGTEDDPGPQDDIIVINALMYILSRYLQSVYLSKWSTLWSRDVYKKKRGAKAGKTIKAREVADTIAAESNPLWFFLVSLTMARRKNIELTRFFQNDDSSFDKYLEGRLLRRVQALELFSQLHNEKSTPLRVEELELDLKDVGQVLFQKKPQHHQAGALDVSQADNDVGVMDTSALVRPMHDRLEDMEEAAMRKRARQGQRGDHVEPHMYHQFQPPPPTGNQHFSMQPGAASSTHLHEQQQRKQRKKASQPQMAEF